MRCKVEMSWCDFFLGIFIVVGLISVPIINNSRYISLDQTQIPSSLNINNTSISLDCYLWRDFMPGSNQDRSLRVSMTLSSNHSSELFSNLIVYDLWIINESIIWHRYLWPILVPIDDNRIDHKSLEIEFRNGPVKGYWNEEHIGDKDGYMDVLISLKNHGLILNLAVSNVQIHYSF